MWQTFGHKAVKQILEKQLDHRRFPHAYLFVGPVGIGKQTLGREFAVQILETKNISACPDFIYYDANDGNGIEGLREFLSRLSQKPFVGQYKVAIIDNMDQANVQVSNALLKTLEEPSPSTILIVISGKHNLLPTIVSRCQVMNFNPFTEQELQQYCQEKGLQCTADVLRASCGAPGRLQYLLDDAKSSKEIAAALVKLEVAQTSGVADRMLLISELAELENDQLCDILTVWLHRQRSRLAERPEQGKLMNQICHSLESLQGTFNKKMVLQTLLLQPNET